MVEAEAQLRRYLADDYLQRQGPDIAYTGLAVAFHGWELARCQAVTLGGGRRESVAGASGL